MERAEAEAIYDQGREAVVAVLLRMDEQIPALALHDPFPLEVRQDGGRVWPASSDDVCHRLVRQRDLLCGDRHRQAEKNNKRKDD